MGRRSAHHATFVIERNYAATPAQVFAAWAEPKAKVRWLVGPEEWERSGHKLDDCIGNPASREKGTRDLLGNLDAELRREHAQ